MENHNMDTVDGNKHGTSMLMFPSELTLFATLIYRRKIEDNCCSTLAIMAFRVGDLYRKGVKIIQTLRYSNRNFKTLAPIEKPAFLDSCKSNHQYFVICQVC